MSTDASVPWILYLAVQYASAPSLQTLSELILKFPDIFSKRVILSILNFIPECIDPDEYLSLVFDEKYEGEDDMDSSQISKTQNINNAILSQKLKKLHIYQDKTKTDNCISDEELYSWFTSKALQIEEETGLISFSRKLVLTSKYSIPPKVREWGLGVVSALESAINRQYNNPLLEFNIPTLREFETLNHKEAIDILLQHLENEEILEEINTSVIPYISYRQKSSKINIWDALWSWLLNFSFKQKNLNLIKLMTFSDIINSEKYTEFSKYAIASCYCHQSTEEENIHSMKIILQNLKQNLNIKTDSDTSVLNGIEISSLNVFTPENIQDYPELITPNFNSLSLLEIMIKTVLIINSSKEMRKITLSEAVCYRNKNKKFQMSLLHKMIPQNPQFLNKLNDSSWIKLRNNIKWLHDVSLIYRNIPEIEYESILLYNILRTTKFNLAKNIYIKRNREDMPLSDDIIEKICIEIFLEFFDSSSNGDITKGNMKNAYNLLQTIKQYYNSEQLESFSYLVKVTNTLHHYSHKFKPVQIRLHNNPFKILEDFLSSNPGIYKSTDKVMEISNDLLLSTNKNYLSQKEIQAKILCVIAETALSQNDFDFAYDICINHLFSLFEAVDIKDTEVLSNIIWKSCLQISKNYEIEESSERIKKKMFLISKVINICPKEYLIEVLNVWRRFEKEQLSIRKSEKLLEFNDSLSISSNIADSMRIPKSLFSSASKAARALGTTLSSTSFPFNKQKILHTEKKIEKESAFTNQELKNSNTLNNLADVVTQKFTSGLGWVLGISDNQK
ncbi:hypothetical protein T552_00086 [Pneumocystis carinii B80]|uniref:Sec39 domain-containing protein n=1 Tax=Pneumocystis carinii (strain B80) TaxID=1408658 RepID=A0A0W4ZSV2_PNEC8|nr:hypothetical protein T552_00086 [Pneumocystis carinii B80]KTW31444.1 hypothetical protein T552_00086 [Pneumocystis carinii B80]